MTPTEPRLAASAERLWRTVDASSALGATADGGLERLALTDHDRDMRDLFVSWCEDAGCEISVDRVGNIFSRRAGTRPDLPAVAIGSHLDTQIAGGRYDGVLGVLAGVEIVRALDDHEIVTLRPIDVVSWTNEEGARFQPPMMGAQAFAGVLEEAAMLRTVGTDGATVGDELLRIGYAGDEPVGRRRFDSYFELHIEQGPELDDAGLDVGIVDGAYASRTLVIEVRGETAHVAATPMPRRRNALVGAGKMIAVVDDIARRRSPDAKSSSTRISTWPNLIGIIPSRSDVTVDLRHPDGAVVDAMLDELRVAAAGIAAAVHVEIRLREVWRGGYDVTFDAACVDLLESVSHALGHGNRTRRMLTQAGHDCYQVSRVAPTALLFCPCRGGISHNPGEAVDRERVMPAVDVLLNAVVARANRPPGAG